MSDELSFYLGDTIIMTAIISLLIGIIIANYDLIDAEKKERSFSEKFRLTLKMSIPEIFEALLYILKP